MPVEQPTNRVLAALAHVDRRHWPSSLERVELRQGHTLLAANAPIEFMYFPEDALVGLLHAGGPDGLEAPLALVGNDGLVGVAPFLGVPAERLRAEVLHPGCAWRLPAAALNSGPQPDDSQMHPAAHTLRPGRASGAVVARGRGVGGALRTGGGTVLRRWAASPCSMGRVGGNSVSGERRRLALAAGAKARGGNEENGWVRAKPRSAPPPAAGSGCGACRPLARFMLASSPCSWDDW